MKKNILTIADIPLSIECREFNSFPPAFKKFKSNNRKSNNHTWCLESRALQKPLFFSSGKRCVLEKTESVLERFPHSRQSHYLWDEIYNRLFYLYKQFPNDLSRISFYFLDPVIINPQKRKISHFYLKDEICCKISDFNSSLIALAYSQILASTGGILLHCACVVNEKKEAFLFFAKSEGGKTTVSKLSKQYTVLSDDIIAIRKIGGEFLAFPTPWKQQKFSNKKLPASATLKAIFFLNKSDRIHFKPLKPEKALVKALSQQMHFLLYTEMPLIKQIFFTAADLFKTLPAYEMYFKKHRNFWPMLEKAIK